MGGGFRSNPKDNDNTNVSIKDVSIPLQLVVQKMLKTFYSNGGLC